MMVINMRTARYLQEDGKRVREWIVSAEGRVTS